MAKTEKGYGNGVF